MKMPLAILISLLLGMSCQQDRTAFTRIAAASNLQVVMPKLVEAYYQEEENKLPQLQVVYGSSGRLSSQISEGAPYNLFLSADTIYTNKLLNAGIGLTSNEFAFGKLAICASSNIQLLDFHNWDKHPTIKIAIANPKLAPYGLEATRYLKSNEIFPMVEHQLVYAQNVQQVNQFVHSGAADVGITSASSASYFDKDRFALLNGSRTYSLHQIAMVLKPATPGASAFEDFLQSKIAQDILSESGYNKIEHE
jgi:molybdate transport system substrate-binding protein